MSGGSLPDGEFENTRSNQRTRSLRSEKAVFGSFQFSRDCIIRDESEGGVRIRIDDPDSIPGEFWLLDIRKFVAFRAHVKWRKGSELGLSLDAERPLDGADTLETKMLRTLALEAKARLGA